MSEQSPTSEPKSRKRLKWEPWALMLLVIGLGVWLVIGPNPWHGPAPHPGSKVTELRVGNSRGKVEITQTPEGKQFRFLLREGYTSTELSEAQFKELFGPQALEVATGSQPNGLFRLLNITSWANMIWVSVGMAGQAAFSGRMLIQWMVSEKRRESVVPQLFWWLSLFGGVLLFAYFVWRQDVVAMLGQSSGIVIYGRNLRLIYKQKRRAGAVVNGASGAGTAGPG